MLDKIFQTRRF